MRLELENVDPEKVGGGDFPEPGVYHFEILEFMESDPRNSATWFDAEVLSGTTRGQEGKIHREYVNWRTAVELAVALKLTTKEELSRHKAAGTDPEIDFQQLAVGRQFVGELQAEEYEGKKRNKLSFRVWAVDSPKSKGVPLSQGKLAEFEQLLAGNSAADDPFGNPAGSDQGQPASGLADDLF